MSAADKPAPLEPLDRDFTIALAGPAPALQPYLDILSTRTLREHMPWLRLTAVWLQGEAQPRWPDPAPATYGSMAELLAAQPDLQLVIALGPTVPPLPGQESVCAPPCISDQAARLFLELLRDTAHSRTCATDLQYANSLFRTIFEEVEEDIILLDTNGVIVDMNRNVYERKGLTREQIEGLSCWEVEGRDFCCEHMDGVCPFKATRRTGRKSEQVHSYVDDSGRMRYFRVYTYPLFDAQRTLTHIMEIRRDITNRTNMELRLQQSEKMAAIGELATYIAHEIRNPLFAIGGFANSLLRASSLDETAREKVSIILEESKRLDKILKSILNFARPTDAQKTVVDINQVAAETMELMSLGCEDKGIQVRLELAPSIARVKGDTELLKQCLINMIKNAMEAMPKGGVMTLRTAMRANRVRLELEDTGQGIPRELREKVFNPFFSTKEQGAGLGLPMTKKIVEEMGGRVELHSQVGKGTRMVLDLLPVLALDEKEQDLTLPPQLPE